MNAFLSNEPGCWASIVSTLAALACPARSSVGASAASCASLAFDAAGGCARFAFAKPLTVPVTCVNAGSSSGRAPGGGTGGGQELVGRQRRRAAVAAAPPRRRQRRPPGRRRAPAGAASAPAGFGALRRRPCPAGSPPAPAWAAAPASSAAPTSGPNPVVVTASADARRLRPPVQVDGHPGRLRRLQPLLDGLDRRLVAAHLPQRRVDVGDRLRARRPHPRRHQRAHGRVPRGPLQRQQSRAARGRRPGCCLPCACPRRARRPAAPPRPPASPARRPSAEPRRVPAAAAPPACDLPGTPACPKGHATLSLASDACERLGRPSAPPAPCPLPAGDSRVVPSASRQGPSSRANVRRMGDQPAGPYFIIVDVAIRDVEQSTV